MFYFTKAPLLLKKIFPSLIWEIKTDERVIYLTFDDGPTPDVTPWVLELLNQYNAKATFFCVGRNIEENPSIVNDIKEQGHVIGNHTYSHLNGWKSGTKSYVFDIEKFNRVFASKLFRPPYGRLKPSQYSILNTQYKIVMWDVLCGDFDAGISKKRCLTNIIKNARCGSIVILHDRKKSEKKLKFVLPEILEYYTNLGYKFKGIEPNV